uniref:Putative AAA ATPase n=1 Tax=Trypanosoma congolense (strain IL3000) TaxID=1068625 RepID=G0V0C1_TRYCI|nr:putative AAA ATPase [Trypanosoma congolense IL3000]
MSLDGVLISDICRLLSEEQPVSFSLLVCGPHGCGKTSTLRAVCEGAVAYGMAVAHGVPALQEECASAADSGFITGSLYVVDYNMLRSLDEPESLSSSTYVPGTVVVIDDVGAICRLLRMQGVLYRFEVFLRRLLSSQRCALLTSAVDVAHVPQWLLELKAPITYNIPELTSSAVRRCVCTLPDADAYLSYVDGIGDSVLASCLHTRRDLILYLCFARFKGKTTHPADSDSVQFGGQLRLPARHKQQTHGKLFGLEGVAERMDALVQHFIKRGGPAVGGLLSSMASTTGILLHGPPGSGKTALVMRYRSLYPERYFSVDCASLFSKYVGESEQRLRDAFVQARSQGPSVLFLDGVEVIGSSRGALATNGISEGVDVSRRMLATLLCELDGVTDGGRVLVIAATTTPHKLDAALLRQGRFETVLYVPPLSYDASREMAHDFFSRFSDADMREDEVQCLAERVAVRAVGSTAASLQALLRVILEKQLELLEGEGGGDGNDPPLPTASMVSAALEGRNQLKPVQYAFVSL